MSKLVLIETLEGNSLWINTEAITRLEMDDDGNTIVYLSDGHKPIATPYDSLDFFMLFLSPKQDVD